jgi:hypothetical protein
VVLVSPSRSIDEVSGEEDGTIFGDAWRTDFENDAEGETVGE